MTCCRFLRTREQKTYSPTVSHWDLSLCQHERSFNSGLCCVREDVHFCVAIWGCDVSAFVALKVVQKRKLVLVLLSFATVLSSMVYGSMVMLALKAAWTTTSSETHVNLHLTLFPKHVLVHPRAACGVLLGCVQSVRVENSDSQRRFCDRSAWFLSCAKCPSNTNNKQKELKENHLK
eukprot:1297227-Amphidinium_carterae.1